MSEHPDITSMLQRVSAGEAGAADLLVSVLYEELRRIARGKQGAVVPGGELTPTGIVHEAYIKLFRDGSPDWENRRHFFFAASRAMRDVVVRHARIRAAVKRGGRETHVPADENRDAARQEATEVLELHEELSRLAVDDKLAAQIVELKFFGGLTYDEIAPLLDIPASRVAREWSFAKARLQDRLANDSAGASRGET